MESGRDIGRSLQICHLLRKMALIGNGRSTWLKKKKQALEKEKWIAAAWDMLYLAQCGINSMVPDPARVAKMDLEKVYARSKSQSLEALTCMAMESLMKSDPEIRIPDENQVLSRWKEEKNKAIAKNLMMDSMREQLFAFLEERGIWHVALKGVVLSQMYPKYGMRQMADNDILFDPSFRQEVHDWFVEQGFEVESFQKSNHDEYHKKPIYNFEMHVSLFQKGGQSQLAEYYGNIKNRLFQKEGKSYEYCMTDEDFYLYLVAHGYKHYNTLGTGLRFLLDLYICNQKKRGMNRSYLDQELNRMGLLTFEHEMDHLAQKVFNPQSAAVLFDKLSGEELAVLEELISSSAYVNVRKLWKGRIQRNQPPQNEISAGMKIRYLLRRLFPDKAYMEAWCEEYEPFLFRHRWLMPAAPIWRIAKRGIQKRKQVKEELDAVRKI